MPAEHRSYDDILAQLSAVKAAVNQVTVCLLEGHLETRVVESLSCVDHTISLETFKGSLSRVMK